MPNDDSQIPKHFLDLTETLLNAQLSAVRKLRRESYPDDPSAPKRGRKSSGRSQLDIIFDILSKSREPLHISEIIRQAKKSHQVDLDRESLVSALSKRVARRDRFMRCAPNTFALLKPQSPKSTSSYRSSASGRKKQ